MGRIEKVKFSDCEAISNNGEGFCVDGRVRSVDRLSVEIAGGSATENGRRGVLFTSSEARTVQDSSAFKVEIRENGRGRFPQIQVAGRCGDTIIEGCVIASSDPGAVGLDVGDTAEGTVVESNRYDIAVEESLSSTVRRAR